jgi:nicotinate-nucleotide adenylyltransferase|nr:MAG TPA: NMNAT protein [Crassvirales sp.]
MKTGLLFGSFDPFHIGHLSMAISALNSKEIDKVLIVPAYQNPWKNKSIANFEARFNLILEGCKGLFNKIYPTRIEETIYNPDTYCTYFVINQIKQRYPEEEFKIITSDETIIDIPDWNYGNKLLEENNFLIYCRPGFEYYPLDEISNCKSYCMLGTSKIEVSSTKIREMLSNHICPVPYISADQYYYIKWNNLYGEKFQY